MTTIAIVGGGIAARSLLYLLAKKKHRQKILVFNSESFASPCSLNSTAIVAPRGISTGHSPLGDSLFEGVAKFSKHFSEDRPAGVIQIPQFTGTRTKMEAFQKRYPVGELTKTCGPFELSDEFYLSREDAFLIRPRVYLDWLLEESKKSLDLSFYNDFVTEIREKKIITQNGASFEAETIIFTAGVQNQNWLSLFSEKKLTRSVQGAYLEFHHVELPESLSLTLDGDNFIYDKEKKTLLLGSTTAESFLALPPEGELQDLYQRLSLLGDWKLPPLKSKFVRLGLREKAPRREPFLLQEGAYFAMGGFYKNGFSLSLSQSEKLLRLIS